MAQKKAHEVDSWLARPDASISFILIYGPDRGLVSERAMLYARGTELPLDDPFSVFRTEAADLEPDIGVLESEIRTVPMFAPRRLIWVRGFGTQKRVGEVLAGALDDMPPDVTILVEAGDLKKGAGLRAAAEKAAGAMCLPCYMDDASALDAMIDGEVQNAGIGISLEARQYLKTLLGGDRLASRAEVGKLALYCLERGRIELEDVRSLVGDVAAASGDDVVEAVLTGKLDMVEQEFRRLEMAGNPAFPVLSALQRQLQQLQLLRGTMESTGKPVAAVVAASRPPIFFKRKPVIEAALRRWDFEALTRHLERLQATILETRRRPQLASALARQFALAIAVESLRRQS